MRDPARIKRILGKLEAYWQRYPDSRLGQIVSNIAVFTRQESDPFYMEDDVLEAHLDEWMEQPL
jgi:uncharacterized protein YihD (DUF1040 family)